MGLKIISNILNFEWTNFLCENFYYGFFNELFNEKTLVNREIRIIRNELFEIAVWKEEYETFLTNGR